MSFNGSGTFVVNSSGQPVVTGTVISSTAFNALTADLATGLSTCVTKDGQTATTVRVPFAFGINSTLTTDATSATTGSIITAGGISTQKALWVGTTSRLVGAVTADAGISSTLTTDATSATTGSIVTAGGISTQKALWVGTTSRHVGAATFDSTITTVNNATVRFGNVNLGGYYDFNSSDAAGNNLANFTMAGLTGGGTLITLNTGTTTGTATALQMNGVASGTNQAEIRNTHATGDRALNITGATGSTGAYQVYFARDSSTAWIMGFKPSSSNNFIISGPAGGGPAFSLPNLTLSATTGAATFASSVTATLFTATATGNNGLGLAAANTPAFYASTTEVMRSTSTQMTLAVPIAITRTVAGALNSVVSTNADTGTGSYATFQARNLTYVSEMAMFGTGWTTSAQYRQNGAIMEANGPGGIVLSASHASGDLFLYNRNTLALTLGASQAATFSSSVTATSYITSSDYRLKENVQPMIGSLDKISALKPVTYDWISDGSSAGGFIAHELQAVMPNAVVGEKDAVDDKGEIKPQGIDFGKVFPHLVAAIQELTTRLAALENK